MDKWDARTKGKERANGINENNEIDERNQVRRIPYLPILVTRSRQTTPHIHSRTSGCECKRAGGPNIPRSHSRQAHSARKPGDQEESKNEHLTTQRQQQQPVVSPSPRRDNRRRAPECGREDKQIPVSEFVQRSAVLASCTHTHRCEGRKWEKQTNKNDDRSETKRKRKI